MFKEIEVKAQEFICNFCGSEMTHNETASMLEEFRSPSCPECGQDIFDSEGNERFPICAGCGTRGIWGQTFCDSCQESHKGTSWVTQEVRIPR